MDKISEKLKNKDLREFYIATINILRDSGRTDVAISLSKEIKGMERNDCSNTDKRDHIVCTLMNVFINKSR